MEAVFGTILASNWQLLAIVPILFLVSVVANSFKFESTASRTDRAKDVGNYVLMDPVTKMTALNECVGY